MAGAETITSRILEDAREEARQQLDAARIRVEEIRGEAKQAIARQNEVAAASVRAEVEAQHERLHNMAALERRKEDLAAKRELMDAVFAQALQNLQQMPEKEYEGFVVNVLKGVARKGDTIVKEAKDTTLTQALLDKSGVSSLKLESTQQALGGGLILRRAGMEMNATFPVLLEQVRAQAEGEVAEILFPSGGKEG